jgi:anti-anti-sigma factor
VRANQQHRNPQLRSGGQTALTGHGLNGQRQGEQWVTVTALPCCAEKVLVLRVTGEVDLLTVGRLRDCLHGHLSGAYRAVVLDCTEVSFLAACGIGLLVEIADRAHAAGVTMRLVVKSRVVLRALQVTGVNELVPRAATVAEAVAQCST